MKKSIALTAAVLFGVLGYVSSAVRSQGTVPAAKQHSKFRRSANSIPGQYIVLLDKQVVGPAGRDSRTAEIADELASVYHGKLTHVYKELLQGFAARMTEEQALALSRDPRVASVEGDEQMMFYGAPSLQGKTVPWGLDRVDQRDAWLDSKYRYRYTGAGVHVYVLDSGINVSHIEFQAADGSHALPAFDAVDDDNDPLTDTNSDGGEADCMDSVGHGTMVAAIIGGQTVGVAKGVTLHSVRVTAGNTASTSNLIAAVNWVTTHHLSPAIVNISVSSTIPAADDPDAPALTQAINNSMAEGIYYVVAAGDISNPTPTPTPTPTPAPNPTPVPVPIPTPPTPDPADACNFVPANIPGVYTVGATTDSDGRWPGSRYGACVDMFAPGVNIVSASYANNTGYAVASSTSFAAPFVTGVLALQLESSPVGPYPEITTPCRVTNIPASTTNKILFSPYNTIYCTLNGGCTGPACQQYVGSLMGTNDSEAQPNCLTPNSTAYTSQTSGYHQGWLAGPSDADFDLHLLKYVPPPRPAVPPYWKEVSNSIHAGSCEMLSYYGTPGMYTWGITSKNGGGNYNFSMIAPP